MIGALGTQIRSCWRNSVMCDSKPQGSRVAQHYNAVPEKGLVERAKSRIYYLRNFNNWSKSMLIADVMRRIDGDRNGKRVEVLDMCCGKGGDLLKWKKAGISRLICADIAEVSLEQCQSRYNSMKERAHRERRNARRDGALFDCEFIHADCTDVRLSEKYQGTQQKFDLTSCQFSLHYAFRSLRAARQMIRNACERLKPGGFFIGTIPNSNALLKLVNSTGKYCNEVFSIEFDESLLPKFAKTEKQIVADLPLFGAKYHFTLDEVVNCPEYLVHFPLLEKLLEEQSMELVYNKTFSELFTDNKDTREGNLLLHKMEALESHEERDADPTPVSSHDKGPRVSIGTMSPAEWEVVALYTAFVFQKKKG